MFPCEKPKCSGRTEIEHPTWRGAGLRRTRVCKVCGHTFETIEVTDASFKRKAEARAVEIAATIASVRATMKPVSGG